MKMKSRKRWIAAAVLCVAIGCTALAGCGSTNTADTADAAVLINDTTAIYLAEETAETEAFTVSCINGGVCPQDGTCVNNNVCIGDGSGQAACQGDGQCPNTGECPNVGACPNDGQCAGQNREYYGNDGICSGSGPQNGRGCKNR